jgi:hypothetical protein
MVLSKEEDAFILFETLNERGLKLSPADLLKTLIMREVIGSHDESKLSQVLKDWDATNSNIGDYPFSKFLRHHLLTLEDDPVQMKRVFGMFKSRVVTGNSEKPLSEMRILKASSVNYKLLLDSDPYKRLNSFSETHRVLLLAVLNDVSDEKARKIAARAIENLAFRWLVCNKNAQVLESKYQDLSKKVQLLKTDEGQRLFIKTLLDAAPDNQAFRENLKLLDREPLQKYLLRRVEEALGGSHAWDEGATLEHLAPQNPSEASNWRTEVPAIKSDDSDPDIDYEKQVTEMGNLSLLEKGLNSAIQNYEWPVKCGGVSVEDGYKGLDASSFLLNRSLTLAPRWTGELIRARSRYLLDAAVNLFSEEWVKSGSVSVSAFAIPTDDDV